MNYGVIGILNKCAFHYKVLLTLLNPIMILTKFNYFWDLKSVVAQGPKRVTVNATGCGFDLHSKKIQYICSGKTLCSVIRPEFGRK